MMPFIFISIYILVTFLITLLLKNNILSNYTSSKDAILRIRKLSIYPFLIFLINYIIITSIIKSFDYKLGIFINLCCLFVSALIAIFYAFLIASVKKTVFNIKDNFYKETLSLFIFYMIMLTLFFVKIMMIFILSTLVKEISLLPILSFILLLLIILFVDRLYIPLLRLHEDKEILNQIVESVIPSKDYKCYIWRSKNTVYGNAFIYKSNKINIVVSDYLIESLTKEELKAILYHEIGHLKLNHLKKRSRYELLTYFIYISVTVLVSLSSLTYKSLTVLLSLTVISFILFIYKMNIFRNQESEADLYCIQNGVKLEDMISALVKLQELNFMIDFTDSQEKIQTHPSFKNRIDFLNKNNIIMKE